MTPTKKLIVESPRGLYRWAKIFNRLQRNFFTEDIELRREKQIKDFITLNGYKKVLFITDTDVFADCDNVRVYSLKQAELVVITDQKFSRYPCPEIINQIKKYIEQGKKLYVCLNRHYINIDNSYHNMDLDSSFTRAITQWLQAELESLFVVDMSLDYIDCGQTFTWAIPDRHYFISK